MADREDIIEVLNLYGFAMDTRRWDLFDRIFTADCDVDYGPTSSWQDREQFKTDFGTFHELFDASGTVADTTTTSLCGPRKAGEWRSGPAESFSGRATPRSRRRWRIWSSSLTSLRFTRKLGKKGSNF